MAPEVIQEIGHGVLADIWSLGITTIEIAEGKPPYSDIHPMRAIFMIPSRPPPTFKDVTRWSPALNDFVSKCLVKNPDARATATELLNHEFIRNAKDLSVLQQMIDEVREIQQTSQFVQQTNATSIHPGLTERPFGLENTLTNRNNDETIQSTRHRSENDHSDTFQSSSCNTMIELSSESSDTMIINETETENDVDSQQDTLKMKTSLPNNLKSSYLHAHQGKRSTNNNNNVDRTKETFMKSIAQEVRLYNQSSDDFQRTMQNFTVEQIEERLALLDEIMEIELKEVQNRFHSKRKPILDAIKLKKQSANPH